MPTKTTPSPEKPAATQDASGAWGDNCTWTYHADTKTLVIDGDGELQGGNFENPSWVQYVGEGISFNSVSISQGIISIGDFAFWGCGCLESVSIPLSMTSIGLGALYCFCLREFRYAGTLTEYLERADLLCKYNPFPGAGVNLYLKGTLLTHAVIPEGVESIPGFAFAGCASLESVSIPSSVISIGHGAFRGCSALASIAIPEGVTSLGAAAFADCTSLESVAIPSSVTSIDSNTFHGCTSLVSIAIPEEVTSIGACAFGGCTSLGSVAIPEGVTSIDLSVFEDCTSLIEVAIPEDVTSIGHSAFKGCSSLKLVTYSGGEAERKAMAISFGNEPLLRASWKMAGRS